jgi:hypothetical protein
MQSRQTRTTKNNTPYKEGLKREQGLVLGSRTQETLGTIERFGLYHTRLWAWYILIEYKTMCIGYFREIPYLIRIKQVIFILKRRCEPSPILFTNIQVWFMQIKYLVLKEACITSKHTTLYIGLN